MPNQTIRQALAWKADFPEPQPLGSSGSAGSADLAGSVGSARSVGSAGFEWWSGSQARTPSPENPAHF